MVESMIIFGGTKGIGKAVAIYFASKGTKVTVAARTIGDLGEPIQQMNYVTVDVSQPMQIEEAFASHKTVYNNYPELVINTAAMQGPIGYSWDIDSDIWIDNINTNLIGSFNVASVAIRTMMTSGSGSIIMFSGGGAVFSRPYLSAYSISKTGILRMVEVMNDELKLAGYSSITIHAIAPGAVKTGMTEEIMRSKLSRTTQEMQAAQETIKTGGTELSLTFSIIEFLSERDNGRRLSGRLIHVKEPYQDIINLYPEHVPDDLGKLRRIPIQGGVYFYEYCDYRMWIDR